MMRRVVLRGHFEQDDAWRAPNKTIKFAVISSSPDFSAERAELSRSVLLRCRDEARHHGVELLLRNRANKNTNLKRPLNI